MSYILYYDDFQTTKNTFDYIIYLGRCKQEIVSKQDAILPVYR